MNQPTNFSQMTMLPPAYQSSLHMQTAGPSENKSLPSVPSSNDGEESNDIIPKPSRCYFSYHNCASSVSTRMTGVEESPSWGDCVSPSDTLYYVPRGSGILQEPTSEKVQAMFEELDQFEEVRHNINRQTWPSKYRDIRSGAIRNAAHLLDVSFKTQHRR